MRPPARRQGVDHVDTEATAPLIGCGLFSIDARLAESQTAKVVPNAASTRVWLHACAKQTGIAWSGSSPLCPVDFALCSFPTTYRPCPSVVVVVVRRIYQHRTLHHSFFLPPPLLASVLPASDQALLHPHLLATIHPPLVHQPASQPSSSHARYCNLQRVGATRRQHHHHHRTRASLAGDYRHHVCAQQIYGRLALFRGHRTQATNQPRVSTTRSARYSCTLLGQRHTATRKISSTVHRQRRQSSIVFSPGWHSLKARYFFVIP